MIYNRLHQVLKKTAYFHSLDDLFAHNRTTENESRKSLHCSLLTLRSLKLCTFVIQLNKNHSSNAAGQWFSIQFNFNSISWHSMESLIVSRWPKPFYWNRMIAWATFQSPSSDQFHTKRPKLKSPKSHLTLCNFDNRMVVDDISESINQDDE